jgi:ribosomal protein S27AE
MPTEQELKNELFKLREILEKKEKEVIELKGKIAVLEKQVGITASNLAAPIPTMSAPQPSSAPKVEGALLAAPTPKMEGAPLAAPTPKMEGSTPAAPTPTIEIAPAPKPATQPRQKTILQKVPTSGTSQLHARETTFECPNCGSHYNSEVDDKTKILYVVGAGTRIYAKKKRCMNCGNEWAA